MSNRFTELMKNNPARLTVEFEVRAGKEQYGWNVTGSIPILSLIGFLGRVQRELQTLDYPSRALRNGPDGGLVVIWDAERRQFEWFIGNIMVDSLCGMLEIIKAIVVAQQAAHMVQAQARPEARAMPPLFGPDGKPFGRG